MSEKLAKAATSAALSTLAKGGDNLAIYNAVLAALRDAAPAASPCGVCMPAEPSQALIDRMTASLNYDGLPPAEALNDADYDHDMTKAYRALYAALAAGQQSAATSEEALALAEEIDAAAALETVGKKWRRLPVGSPKLIVAALRQYAAPASSPEPDAVREKLHNAIDSLVVQDLARVFSVHGFQNKSMSEQIVDILLPAVTLAAPALSRPAHGGWPTREAVAAEIDPVAFDPISLNDTHPGWASRRERALETADRIYALARNDRQSGGPRS